MAGPGGPRERPRAPGGRRPGWPRAPILAGGRCRGPNGEAQGSHSSGWQVQGAQGRGGQGTRGQGDMVAQGSHSSEWQVQGAQGRGPGHQGAGGHGGPGLHLTFQKN